VYLLPLFLKWYLSRLLSHVLAIFVLMRILMTYLWCVFR
jgi:hypothetical protein